MIFLHTQANLYSFRMSGAGCAIILNSAIASFRFLSDACVQLSIFFFHFGYFSIIDENANAGDETCIGTKFSLAKQHTVMASDSCYFR